MSSAALLTIDQIREMARCLKEPARFVELFGDSVIVTVADIMAVSREFDWADSIRLLDAQGQGEYSVVISEARIVYYRALSSARRDPKADFLKAREDARKVWDHTLAPAWAAAYIASEQRAGRAL
jgi:hypothetical protein